jgi:hypothetical protein
MEKITRWDLVTSDAAVEVYVESIVLSGRKVTDMRKELIRYFLKYRNELLHGEQPSGGCGNKKCKVCYPYGYRK